MADARSNNHNGHELTPRLQIWGNLNQSSAALARKKTIGWSFLFAVCFFNTIPLFIISILANLASLTSFVPFLQEWSDASPGSFTFISGVLPPAVSALFGFFLPIIMRWLSKYQGAQTQSRLDRAVVARYFAFLVISQLVIFTLIGVIFSKSCHFCNRACCLILVQIASRKLSRRSASTRASKRSCRTSTVRSLTTTCA